MSIIRKFKDLEVGKKYLIDHIRYHMAWINGQKIWSVVVHSQEEDTNIHFHLPSHLRNMSPHIMQEMNVAADLQVPEIQFYMVRHGQIGRHQLVTFHSYNEGKLNSHHNNLHSQ